MSLDRAIEIVYELKDILDEIKNDEDKYLVYHIGGLDRAIHDFNFLIEQADGDNL